jgi:Flp pilus assembly protein TadG
MGRMHGPDGPLSKLHCKAQPLKYALLMQLSIRSPQRPAQQDSAPDAIGRSAWHRIIPRRSRDGQSLVEFALILPVLLALTGMAIDTSRVYFQWLDLESATRDAAQYVASDPGLVASGGTYLTGGGYYDPNDTTNYCGASWTTCTAAPSTDAKLIIDRATNRSFTKSATQTDVACTSGPRVWAVLQPPDTTAANGGNASFPVATVKVTACVPFRTLFSYPFISSNGTWFLRTERTFSTIVGR